MEQLTLFDMSSIADKWQVQNFSADNFGRQSARMSLEQKLIPITVVSDDFSRQSVSYQLSKNDCLHRWLKYKEGFSADLVKKLLQEFGIKAGDTVLDPFAGSGTTNLVCKMQGYFTELCFIYAELFRLCKSGAKVALRKSITVWEKP